jgi:hypothetical protein
MIVVNKMRDVVGMGVGMMMEKEGWRRTKWEARKTPHLGLWLRQYKSISRLLMISFPIRISSKTITLLR